MKSRHLSAVTLLENGPEPSSFRASNRTGDRRVPPKDGRSAEVQSAASIPTSSAADTNARLANGVRCSPRITPRQAIIAALRLAVSRGNAFSRTCAASLMSMIVRSLPPVRMTTGRSKRFTVSLVCPMSASPSHFSTACGSGSDKWPGIHDWGQLNHAKITRAGGKTLPPRP